MDGWCAGADTPVTAVLLMTKPIVCLPDSFFHAAPSSLGLCSADHRQHSHQVGRGGLGKGGQQRHSLAGGCTHACVARRADVRVNEMRGIACCLACGG